MPRLTEEAQQVCKISGAIVAALDEIGPESNEEALRLVGLALFYWMASIWEGHKKAKEEPCQD